VKRPIHEKFWVTAPALPGGDAGIVERHIRPAWMLPGRSYQVVKFLWQNPRDNDRIVEIRDEQGNALEQMSALAFKQLFG
jgi:hypothetical protein